LKSLEAIIEVIWDYWYSMHLSSNQRDERVLASLHARQMKFRVFGLARIQLFVHGKRLDLSLLRFEIWHEDSLN